MTALPSLDVHAHVATDIGATDLEKLGAVVLIATRSVEEFQLVAARNDLVSVWGVGCHPSLVKVQKSFDSEAFHRALAKTPFVSEVGLDGDSRVAIDLQQRTFRTITRLLATSPRIVSIHSFKAADLVLDILDEFPGAPGRVLHWWLGTPEQTARAINMGLTFSVNFSMIRSTEIWKQVPLDRLLVETDHPHGDRFSPRPRQPGLVLAVESALARQHGISAEQLRQQTWTNFRRLVDQTNTHRWFPVAVQRMLEAARVQ